MPALTVLTCSDCNLSGNLQLGGGTMANVQRISLAGNSLTGTVPHLFAPSLLSLVLDGNQIVDQLDSWMVWHWPSLQELSLAHNLLQGQLPPGTLQGAGGRLWWPACMCLCVAAI